MPASRNPNRSMFWRIIRRLLSANRGRLFVILLALGAGAAVTAALLNLQVDAKRRLTTEFRRFGANVILAPQQPEETSGVQTLSETLLDRLPKSGAHNPISAVELLYATADVTAYDSEAIDRKRIWSGPAVIAGFRWVGQDLAQSGVGLRRERLNDCVSRGFLGEVGSHGDEVISEACYPRRAGSSTAAAARPPGARCGHSNRPPRPPRRRRTAG